MLTVKINTDNAAFEGDNLSYECAAILRKIADKIEAGAGNGLYQTVLDSNGNDVGRWRVTDPGNKWRDND